MTTNIVEPNDRVRDPLDGTIRTVSHVSEDTVHMTDGGVMGLDECTEVYLPSESVRFPIICPLCHTELPYPRNLVSGVDYLRSHLNMHH